jgi:hypothetical protein
MDGAVNSASIAASIAMGTSLLAGGFGMFVAMRAREGGAARRDRTVSILRGIGLLLTVLYAVAVSLMGVWGMAYLGLLKATLLLTASFAVVGMLVGLMRGLRRRRAIGRA